MLCSKNGHQKSKANTAISAREVPADQPNIYPWGPICRIRDNNEHVRRALIILSGIFSTTRKQRIETLRGGFRKIVPETLKAPIHLSAHSNQSHSRIQNESCIVIGCYGQMDLKENLTYIKEVKHYTAPKGEQQKHIVVGT